MPKKKNKKAEDQKKLDGIMNVEYNQHFLYTLDKALQRLMNTSCFIFTVIKYVLDLSEFKDHIEMASFQSDEGCIAWYYEHLSDNQFDIEEEIGFNEE
ncbi:unnamed protein product [Cunninghamella blakesleeana]